jgi:pimeloyl-ACP methyl ester carboxylesterase
MERDGRAPLWRASSAASFVPAHPARVLVLAHGYPWPDGSPSDGDLIEYALTAVRRWRTFAEAHHAVVIAPAFGGGNFAGYREMFGRSIDPDEFVDLLVDEAAKTTISNFSGRFSLHGHSAGAQFAARYLVTHPERLDAVVLSAPSTYPFPNPAIPWPNGMAVVARNDADARESRTRSDRSRSFAPRSERWLAAASDVSVSVLVGSRDTEPRPAAPGQLGSTRIERAGAWVESMRGHAESNGRTPTIRLVMVEGLDHDEGLMTTPAQEILARAWEPRIVAGLLECWARFCQLPGVEERRSAFRYDDALWVEGREIAHLEPPDLVDLRLTRQVIRARRPALRNDPRVTLRPSSSADWLTLRWSSPTDDPFFLECVNEAVTARHRS